MVKRLTSHCRDLGSVLGQQYLQLVGVFQHTQLVDLTDLKPFRVYFLGAALVNHTS